MFEKEGSIVRVKRQYLFGGEFCLWETRWMRVMERERELRTVVSWFSALLLVMLLMIVTMLGGIEMEYPLDGEALTTPLGFFFLEEAFGLSGGNSILNRQRTAARFRPNASRSVPPARRASTCWVTKDRPFQPSRFAPVTIVNHVMY